MAVREAGRATPSTQRSTFRNVIGTADRWPFPNLIISDFVDAEYAAELLIWLETEAVWRSKSDEFYEVYDANFLHATSTPVIERFRSEAVCSALTTMVSSWFGGIQFNPQVDIHCQKMTPGLFIDLHTDYSEHEQTHRVVLQLSRGWTKRSGGFLALVGTDLGSADGYSPTLVMPIHRSAVAFEISRHSYHAVTPIGSGERYTLVYSFHAAGGYTTEHASD